MKDEAQRLASSQYAGFHLAFYWNNRTPNITDKYGEWYARAQTIIHDLVKAH